MSGTLFCVLAFFTCALTTAGNWRYGLCALMAWGYFFGILKAHYVATWGHFIFDAATVGFYSGMIIKFPQRHEQQQWKQVLPWVVALMAWPIFMALIPIQHYIVQLVGLRGNMFWIPILLVGALLDKSGKNLLTFTLSILNIVALGFALAEYFLGVETFVPENEVTLIVYNSNDIAGGNKRIPSIFANAHSYAGMMVATIPWLVLGIFDKGRLISFDALRKPFLIVGLVCGLLGIFIAGPRSPIVLLGLLLVLTFLSGRINLGFLLVSILAGTVVAYFVAQNERMQRFTELQDLEMVSARMSLSLNMTFFEVLLDFPMGNGMGAGGTSLPFFAQSLLSSPVVIENEYARILLEQGLPGLILFIAFVCWFLTRRIPKSDEAAFGKTLIWFYSALIISTAWIGIGMMTSIPCSAILLLGIGYCTAPVSHTFAGKSPGRQIIAGTNSFGFKPAYQRGLSRV